MTSIDTATSTTGLIAEGATDPTSDEAPITALATKSSTGAASNAGPTGSTFSSIDDLVSGVEKQVAAASVSGGKLAPVVKMLESMVTLVGLLASLTKAFMSVRDETPSSIPVAGGAAGKTTTTKPTEESVSKGGTATNKNSGSTATEAASTPKQSFFEVAQSDAGVVTVRSLDGYIVRAEGREEAWSITAPDGKTTRIWGDPHVTESDGDRWDFKERSTFIFGNNKATVEVIPAGNGETFSSRLTLYCGDERVTIGGIDKNKPVITHVSHDGKQHDDSLADGTSYRRTSSKSGEGWATKVGGKTKQMGH